jgi:hypothetical protein
MFPIDSVKAKADSLLHKPEPHLEPSPMQADYALWPRHWTFVFCYTSTHAEKEASNQDDGGSGPNEL